MAKKKYEVFIQRDTLKGFSLKKEGLKGLKTRFKQDSTIIKKFDTKEKARKYAKQQLKKPSVVLVSTDRRIRFNKRK